MATNAIYKAGIPAVTGKATAGTLGTQPATTGAANYVNPAVSSVTGVAVNHGANSDNG